MLQASFAAAVTLLLLAGCGQPADNQADNQADTAVPGERTPIIAASLAIKPLPREAALKLMHDRHENMEKIGDALKLVGREMKRGAPDLAKVRTSARTFTEFGPQIPGWFPPGTGPDVGKTRAKAEIWQKPADFTAKAKAMNAAAIAFQTAARGSDPAAIRAAQGNLGKSCKACHDLYRAEKR